ncbi:hypothetical protein J2S40_001454 [Nocardioides luteus]|nr:hypothetical protein [Nocardioides luteus]MDR7310396.1 hypothetical protein [Nocardioides luteus]
MERDVGEALARGGDELGRGVEADHVAYAVLGELSAPVPWAATGVEEGSVGAVAPGGDGVAVALGEVFDGA